MILGSPITVTITSSTVLGILLAALVATGTEAVIRSHPRSHELLVPGGRLLAAGRHWAYWALPVAVVIVALLLLPVTPSRFYWLAGLAVTGVSLGLSLAGCYYTLDPFATGYRRARIGMNALTYAVALALFLVVYRTRTRSIVSATEVMLVSSLLALELLRGSARPLSLIAVYAGICGLLLGEATWALNYWRLDSLTGGLILLLMFYNVVGLGQNALQGRVSRRLLIEYFLITVAAAALIWEFAP
jgi:hypothetical protein